MNAQNMIDAVDAEADEKEKEMHKVRQAVEIANKMQQEDDQTDQQELKAVDGEQQGLKDEIAGLKLKI